MLVNKENYASRWRVRPDGVGKVTGETRFLTDMTAPGMLIGKVLRSPHPHAWLLSVDTAKALALPGVHAVLTHRDVPGMNRYGIAVPDQPVFCEDRVRYEGDAVAAVAAESEEIAEQALALIEAVYEPLPAVTDPEEALMPDSPRIHPNGNVAHTNRYLKGDPVEAFADCVHIVETTYSTPRQMHAYMETEGGLFVPDADGEGLTVYSPTQHGFKDQMQLVRILSLPEERIRVLSSPIGGSFGGKDELNVQPYGALLALATGRPVKMHNSRWESVRAGLKRHPMKITMKTGVDREGRLLAHTVRIVADKGPYSTLGPAVLNFALEHSQGAYRIPHVKIEGMLVFTNNGMSGEFRGFGGNQAVMAVEGQMDRLAALLGMDPWEFRRRNLRKPDDLGPVGQRMLRTDGAVQAMDALERSELWQQRKQRHGAEEPPPVGQGPRRQEQGSSGQGQDSLLEPRQENGRPWIRRGIGAAMVMHGSGLGYGLPDPGGGRLKLTPDGKLEVSFGYEECGQGMIGALMLMMEDYFQCAREDVEIVIGDTSRVPDSGSSTASRTTTMIWQALRRMQPGFTGKLLAAAAALAGLPQEALRLGPGGIWTAGSDAVNTDSAGAAEGGTAGRLAVSYAELARHTAEPIAASTRFHYPVTPDAVFGGHYLYGYASVATEVEVNLLTGFVKVNRVHHAVAAGPVINPMGYVGQIEGGASMALGFALMEDAVMNDGLYVTRNLDAYLIPTIRDTPKETTVDAIEELPDGDPFGPRGIGEIGSVGLAPAIAAAVYDAVGIWLDRMPIRAEEVLERTAHLLPFHAAQPAR